jgi:predicted short-subunit dehydrogenase-like oxidoreductase (DUF2520 family)
MPKKNTIAVIGKGKVGSSLAQRINAMKGYQLFAHLSARKTSFKALWKKNGPEVIFICCKDDQISNVAKRAVKNAGTNLKLVVHCSGSRDSSILPPKIASRLVLHPIQTFSTVDPTLMKDIYYMISGVDPFALTWARKFVDDIGGAGFITISGKDLPLYHLLVVFASNFTVLIGRGIERMAKSLRVSPASIKKAIAPLMRTSVENVLHNDAKKILTGPIARKDYSTILKHRKALRSQPAALSKIYEGFLMLAEQ